MYNPSVHTATNKPIGLTNKPVDARTYYYDSVAFAYRPYASTSEVIGYLIGNDRVGQFSIIVGTDEYWFKNGIADADLILKDSSGGIAPISYAVAANTAVLNYFVAKGSFTEIATIQFIENTTRIKWVIVDAVVNSPFDGWTITLPGTNDGGDPFLSTYGGTIWVKE